jgi:DNA-binding response OmpR family regulator
MRALVIEDDKLYLIFVCRTLEKHGWEVDAAVNGRAALALMRDRAFDLVITDIFMPEQEGMETIARIAAEFPDTRILAMSGGTSYPDFNILEFARKLGADGCISKPFMPNALMAQIAGLAGARLDPARAAKATRLARKVQ